MELLKKNDSIECVRNGCSFKAEDMSTMLCHFKTCVLVNGETFYCTRCNHGPDSRDIIEEHIKTNHSLGVIEAIDVGDFSDSDDDAELGEESSESEGESGDDESLNRDYDGENDVDDDDDDGWNAKGYKKKRIRDWGHNEVMVNGCLDRKGNLLEYECQTLWYFDYQFSKFCFSSKRSCKSSKIVCQWSVFSANFGMDSRFVREMNNTFISFNF